MAEVSVEVRSNRNASLATIEAVIQYVLNKYNAKYSGWVGTGADAYVIFWCDDDDYASLVEDLTEHAFHLR